jgi:hypothetical protein
MIFKCTITQLSLCLMLIAGCRKPARSVSTLGVVAGNHVTNSHEQFDAFVVQYRRPTAASTKRTNIFAVCWKRNAGTSTTSTDDSDRLTAINSHQIVVDWSKAGVYALQPDYSIKELPLDDAARSHIFDLIQSSDARGPFEEDPIWKTLVDPHLQIVNEMQGR